MARPRASSTTRYADDGLQSLLTMAGDWACFAPAVRAAGFQLRFAHRSMRDRNRPELRLAACLSRLLSLLTGLRRRRHRHRRLPARHLPLPALLPRAGQQQGAVQPVGEHARQQRRPPVSGQRRRRLQRLPPRLRLPPLAGAGHLFPAPLPGPAGALLQVHLRLSAATRRPEPLHRSRCAPKYGTVTPANIAAWPAPCRPHAG